MLLFTNSMQNIFSAKPLSLDDLPSELILHICSYLPRDVSFVSLRCTNRRLNSLLNCKTFIRTDCLQIEEGIKPKLLLSVLATSFKLKVFNASGCLAITDDLLTYLSKNCRSITDVDVSGCVLVTNVGLQKIALYLRHIERLSVANTRQVTCEGLTQLMIQHTNTMKALNISCCYGLEDSQFRLTHLSEFCPELEKLEYRSTMEHSSSVTMWASKVLKFCNLCPKLNYLDVSCSPSHNINVIISTLTASCREMRCLKLSRCWVQDDCLLKLSSLSNLQQLDLSRSPELCGVSLVFTLRQLPWIHWLDLSGCCKLTNESMPALLSALPNVRELLLRDCFEIGDKGLSQAPRLAPNLGFLDVSGTMLSTKGAQSIITLGGPQFVLITDNCPLMCRLYDHIWQRIPIVSLPGMARTHWFSDTDDI
jgi:hypothetical protein